MPFENLNGSAMGSDLSYLFIYLNSITNGAFVPIMLLAFFLVVLLGSVFAQMRFTTRWRFETSFAAASFATFGFAMIMMTVNGLLNVFWLGATVFVMIMSVLWLILSPSGPEY